MYVLRAPNPKAKPKPNPNLCGYLKMISAGRKRSVSTSPRLSSQAPLRIGDCTVFPRPRLLHARSPHEQYGTLRDNPGEGFEVVRTRFGARSFPFFCPLTIRRGTRREDRPRPFESLGSRFPARLFEGVSCPDGCIYHRVHSQLNPRRATSSR